MRFTIGPLEVPPLALGTMYFGTTVATEQAMACLDRAHELGARFWDTANNYAFWAGGTGDESETVIGRWLARRGPRVRDDVVLATKLGARPATAGDGLDHTLGLSSAAVHSQLTDCLRRLGTDHVDLLYAHVDDPRVPFEETLGALGELVQQGKARAVAASNLPAHRLRAAVRADSATHYQALQQRFSYLVPAVDADLSPHVLLDDEVRQVSVEAGLTCLGYSPLLGGAYTRDDRPWPQGYRPSDRAIAALHQVGADHGLDAGQTVLSWMVHRELPVVPVVGASTPDQVASAWHAVSTGLPSALTARLDRARRG